MKKQQTDPYDQSRPAGGQKPARKKGQATIKTNIPPDERPEAANS